MRRRLVLAVLVLAVGVGYVVDRLGEITWVGGHDLTVHVESRGAPIRAVSGEAFSHREVAEQAAADLRRPEGGRWEVTVDPFDGRPLTVTVRASGRQSGWLRRELGRFQFRFLVVVVTYADGRRAAKLVDIPDGRVSREVRVAFD